MSEVERYGPCYECEEMHSAKYGDWVRYEDYEAALQVIRGQRKIIDALAGGDPDEVVN